MLNKSRVNSRIAFYKCVSAAAISLYAQSIVCGQSYSVTNIDNFITAAGSGITNDVNGSVGLGLNDNDQVVGYYNYDPTLFHQIPFVFNASGGTVTAINRFSSGYMASANAINNAGVVVGNGQVGSTYAYAQSFAYNSVSGAFTAVAPLGNGGANVDIPYSSFSGINNAGTAVGYSYATNSTNSYRAITYNVSSGSGTPTNIGNAFSGPVVDGRFGNEGTHDPSLNSNEAFSINDKGQIAGFGPNTGGVSKYGTDPTSTVGDLYVATPNASGAYTTSSFNDITAAVTSLPRYYAGSWTNCFIDAQGNVAGTNYASTYSSHSFQAFFYNASSGTATIFEDNAPYSTFVQGIADVNGVPIVVGSAGYGAFIYENGVMTNISHLIPGYTLSSANGINSHGDIVATGSPTAGGPSQALLLTQLSSQSITYTGAGSSTVANGSTNFTPAAFATGDILTFDDSATGSTTITIGSSIAPSGVTFANNNKNYVINGAAIGSVYGVGVGSFFNVIGSGSVTLNNVNTYVGSTNVSSGKLILGVTGALPVNGTLLIGSGGTVIAAAHGTGPKVVLQTASLSIAGTAGNWTGKLDLNDNDLISHNGPGSTNLLTLISQLQSGYAGGTWQGSAGITSSTAAADPRRTTALAVIQNSVDGSLTGQALYGSGGSLGSTFDGVSTVNTDVLVKYTYYGDTNLDGAVDGSDYSRIDAAYSTDMNFGSVYTGWYNGDFNYDGTIDGSDYTLIDNAFNAQAAVISAQIVNPTAQISSAVSTVAVPEPTSFALSSLAAIGVLKRRRR